MICRICETYSRYCEEVGKEHAPLVGTCIPWRRKDGSFTQFCNTKAPRSFSDWLYGRERTLEKEAGVYRLSGDEIPLERYRRLQDKYGRGD